MLSIDGTTALVRRRVVVYVLGRLRSVTAREHVGVETVGRSDLHIQGLERVGSIHPPRPSEDEYLQGASEKPTANDSSSFPLERKEPDQISPNAGTPREGANRHPISLGGAAPFDTSSSAFSRPVYSQCHSTEHSTILPRG
jgi:hypothetical protein